MIQTAPAAPASASTARILVVDDEQQMCEICARTLRLAGYDVVATTSVSEALAALRPDQPLDLLLADIQMPGMSGLEIARRALEFDPAMAIIIMTGHASIENLQQSARRGIADFLAKPFDLQELRFAVDRALQKRQLLQDSIRLKSVEQLLHSSEALNAILNREELCRVILDRAMGHVPCRVGLLFLRDGDGPALTLPEEGWEPTPAALGAVARAYEAGGVVLVADNEALCTGPDGAVGRGMAVPLRAHGSPVGAILLCDDSPGRLRPVEQDMLTLLANQAGTALHNAQLYGELEQAYQSLRELDRLKSEFIAIASHELRTPLSIVLGYTMMVRDQSEGERRAYVQRVLDSAHRIKQIVDDMVSLRHLERHEVPLTPEACRLDELLESLRERFVTAAQEKRIDLSVEAEAGISVLVDREKLLLVLGNLVSNAIKFTYEQGAVKVKAEIWPREQLLAAAQAAVANPSFHNLGPSSAERWVVTQVCDNGIGIDRREQARIFERFYQVADSLTREHGGAGLGLALVRDLTDVQGGLVWVESTVGGGSTFCCALPYQPAEHLHGIH